MSLRICSWNVANAIGDETSPNGRFGLRMNSQIDLLKNQNIDILMLQEIRQCKDESGNNIIIPLDIVYAFAKGLGMNIAGFEPINPSMLSFWRCTLYNPNTVWSMDGSIPVRTYNTHNTDYVFDKDFGREILFNRFAPINEQKTAIYGTKSLWIGNVHYPLKLADKMAYGELIIQSIIKICSSGGGVLISGDCNVFMDEGGTEQIQQLENSGLIEHTGHIKHTFVSFPWDKVQTKSHLDYVFTSADVKVKDVTAIDVSESRISDHFPVITTVTL